jgi:hypothetical protein
VLAQNFLDFSGCNVFPAADNHVFLAVDNVQVTVVVKAADVSGE